MPTILLLNKPFNVLCQFTDATGRKNLGDFINDDRYRRYYAAGRLDRDSEGLVLLTDNGTLQNQIAHPKHKMPKTYWVQVDGEITDEALEQLSNGIELKDGLTKPARAKRMTSPNIWEREPPIRERKHIPTSWLELTISEGRNRQVRRMTAAAGFPTLRLVRFSIGDQSIEDLKPGEYKTTEMSLLFEAKDKVESRTMRKRGSSQKVSNSSHPGRHRSRNRRK